MFEVPNNPELNEAIRDEIRSSTRRLGDVVLFDWDRDGTFDHQYTDLSKLVIDVQLERSSLVTDLPEAVNTVQGYSSSELTIILEGSRYSDELKATELLSPFYAGSPFFNQRLTGVQMLYRKAVTLPTGGTYYIPQFRGTIRDISFDRKTEQVRITCTDIDKWINRLATLPHWAVNMQDRTFGVAGAARPINGQWIMGELLAKADTPIGPRARPDSVFFASGNGGFIPRVGTIARNQPPYAGAGLSPADRDIWVEGQYGLCMMFQPEDENLAWLNAHTSRSVLTNSGQRLGFNAWAWSNGSGVESPFPGGTDLTPQYYNEGTLFAMSLNKEQVTSVTAQIMSSGQVFVRLLEGTDPYSDQWRWSFPPLVQGWHYFDINIQFNESSVTCTLTVDGTVISPSLNAPGTGAYQHINPVGEDEHNQLFLYCWGEAQHFQIYNGVNAAYDAAYKDPPVDFDGIPLTSFIGAHAEFSWVPDIESANVWETLGRQVSSEFGVLYTNEGGTLIYRPHWWARDYGDPVESYSVDDILGLVTNPSLDQYKNRIELSYTNRFATIDYWSPEDGNQHPCPDDNVVRTVTYPLTQEAIQFDYDGFSSNEITDSSWDNYRNTNNFWWRRLRLYTTTLMDNTARNGRDPNNDSNTADAIPNTVWTYPSDDCREFTLYYQVPATGAATGLYIGAGKSDSGGAEIGDMAPNMRLTMMRYGDRQIGWVAYQNTTEVNEHGAIVLRLEPTDWRQWKSTADAITPELLEDTVVPAPTIHNFAIPTDPRLQLLDVITITAESNFSGAIRAQIVGIRRSSRDAIDYLDLRIIATPTTWQLGISGASELGVSTYLGD